ncbi:hypothetical protein G6Z25_02510 [Clostridium perfringens]|uniref:hypothetical protein n=1 Tax=Clostridium perfringens TaxID=1502 RepID=UPI0013E3C920|nr:hypothetical protein [Clostridium perfringens]NGS95793.1 hypothetical protein [Clostridium perfringens]
MIELIKNNKDEIFEITCVIGVFVTMCTNNVKTLKIMGIFLVLQIVYFCWRILKYRQLI